MMMARKNLIAAALLAALVLASAMPSRAGRSLLDEAVDNATAEEMPALSMPAVDNATADVMPAMPAANATADEMPAANATAEEMPAAANATETDGASDFNQGSPDCIKPGVTTTRLVDAAYGSQNLSTLAAAIKAAGLENAFDDTSAKVCYLVIYEVHRVCSRPERTFVCVALEHGSDVQQYSPIPF